MMMAAGQGIVFGQDNSAIAFFMVDGADMFTV
jgi:hypothetical protein